MFEHCYKLKSPITDNEVTVLTGTATDTTVNALNCRGMFYGSGITDRVPANLFDSCRSKLKNTSYMFAKCYNLSGIDMGYATDYNIPYKYDGSEVKYYYEHNKADLTAYSTYSSFKAAMSSYFTDTVRDNWFGEGKQFDRYRNYLEQWFFTQSRHYPEDLTVEDFTGTNKITTITTKAELENLSDGRYYVTEEANVGLWQKDGATISQLSSAMNSKRVYLLDPANGIYSITSIAESGESVTIEDLTTGDYRPVGTQETTLFSKFGYYNANNKYTIVQRGLLSDCTSLTNITYMFAGCYGLTGCIPADMFAYTKAYTGLESLEGLFAGCSNLTLEAIPQFNDNKIGMIMSWTTAPQYNSTVWDSLGETADFKALSNGGYYSKIYPTVVYTKTGDQYDSVVIDGETEDEDLANYFVPKDWLAKLTAVSNINHLFNTVGLACDFRTDDLGCIQKPEPKALGRPSTEDTSGFNNSSSIYNYLKLDNTTFNTTSRLASASSAFKNVHTLGATEIGQNFLYTSRSSLKDISYIFYTATLRQVKKPFGSAVNLTSVKDCFYGLNANYNLGAGGYDGPCADVLYAEPEDGKPISWMTGTSNKVLYGSEGPELWKCSRINSAHKLNCLASLTPVSGRETWFNYRVSDPGSSVPFDPTTSISTADAIRI